MKLKSIAFESMKLNTFKQFCNEDSNNRYLIGIDDGDVSHAYDFYIVQASNDKDAIYKAVKRDGRFDRFERPEFFDDSSEFIIEEVDGGVDVRSIKAGNTKYPTKNSRKYTWKQLNDVVSKLIGSTNINKGEISQHDINQFIDLAVEQDRGDGIEASRNGSDGFKLIMKSPGKGYRKNSTFTVTGYTTSGRNGRILKHFEVLRDDGKKWVDVYSDRFPASYSILSTSPDVPFCYMCKSNF